MILIKELWLWFIIGFFISFSYNLFTFFIYNLIKNKKNNISIWITNHLKKYCVKGWKKFGMSAILNLGIMIIIFVIEYILLYSILESIKRASPNFNKDIIYNNWNNFQWIIVNFLKIHIIEFWIICISLHTLIHFGFIWYLYNKN